MLRMIVFWRYVLLKSYYIQNTTNLQPAPYPETRRFAANIPGYFWRPWPQPVTVAWPALESNPGLAVAVTTMMTDQISPGRPVAADYFAGPVAAPPAGYLVAVDPVDPSAVGFVATGLAVGFAAAHLTGCWADRFVVTDLMNSAAGFVGLAVACLVVACLAVVGLAVSGFAVEVVSGPVPLAVSPL